MLSLLSLLPALLPLAASSPLLLPQEQPSQLTFSTSPDPSCLASFLPSLPCLVSHHALSADDIVDLVRHVGSLSERRLVEYVHAEEGDEVQQMWITEGEKALLKLAGRRFWDVTGLVEAVEPFESELKVPPACTPGPKLMTGLGGVQVPLCFRVNYHIRRSSSNHS